MNELRESAFPAMSGPFAQCAVGLAIAAYMNLFLCRQKLIAYLSVIIDGYYSRVGQVRKFCIKNWNFCRLTLI